MLHRLLPTAALFTALVAAAFPAQANEAAIRKAIAERMPNAPKIDEIRRSIGFDEDLVQELAERDLVREARWQNGYAYMEARGMLEARYGQNGVPEIELDLLREQYFQHEASTIKREETDIGFYRYNRPRVYGRN